MQRTINVAAFLFFIWLIVAAFELPDILLNFLLVGALPGTNETVSPTIMLAIMTTTGSVILFELMARRFNIFRRIHYHFTHMSAKRERLPKRRFGRVPAN